MMNNPDTTSSLVAWSMNIISSVGIIIVNKQVMSGYGFRFAVTLTGLHFIVTAGVGFVSSLLGLLSNKTTVSLWDLAWFSLVANLSLVGMNVSLLLNSVGFYQISKLSIIPTVCLADALITGKQFSRDTKLAVVIVMLGVGIATVTDVKINFMGLMAAVLAVVTTALQQIYIGTLQKKYSIGSFDLLSQTAPIQAASLTLVGPFLDYALFHTNIAEYSLSPMASFFITISCVLAVGVNVSQYLCIGKFSAVTFQVLGHMKTVLVLVLGWLLFPNEATFSVKNIGGMLLAVVGMIFYSWAVEQVKKEKSEEKSLPTPKTPKNEEEAALLAPLPTSDATPLGLSAVGSEGK
eukprot:TRINITY_DN13446_c0_g1_i1.p1 TRINITY_DN13446_c0_g1~~TRINITY_DN13446_c0_g1_i1.p1  ORF type:complete len:349 (+),score=61.03 TRINITY_DN13446_c0_g1_i1:128-1174(+)